MPRKPRLEYAGAIYHVMNRGDHKERIFIDENDRHMFRGNPLIVKPNSA